MHPSQLVLLEGLDDPCVVLHLLTPRLRGRVLEEGLNGNAYIWRLLKILTPLSLSNP